MEIRAFAQIVLIGAVPANVIFSHVREMPGSGQRSKIRKILTVWAMMVSRSLDSKNIDGLSLDDFIFFRFEH